MMRFVAVVLALLAGAKIWTHEQIYRSATEDALVQAYRGRAIASCRTAPLPNASEIAEPQIRAKVAAAFSTPSSARLEIGNREISVPVWEVNHAAWPMRYTYPYIILETANPAARCAYDVKLDRANIVLF